MAGLDGIIKFKKWELDEKRRALSKLESERDEIQKALRCIQNERAAETAQVLGEVALLTLGSYLHGAQIKEEYLCEKIKTKDDEIVLAQDCVADAFKELKTYEIAEENKRKSQKYQANKQEQDNLDEQGLQVHQRVK